MRFPVALVCMVDHECALLHMPQFSCLVRAASSDTRLLPGKTSTRRVGVSSHKSPAREHETHLCSLCETPPDRSPDIFSP